ncbi:efflux transporter outer membrane subunit [Myroides marinus]|uniref:Efflux transporter, outer membrane factor (OMF) lipoprotein, NodT family n=1 Tax=Myroides marinus TaxID=703342 RepID=A0A165Q995_9FLAO|nr:efflux transporter outer membrane subunit [Myroides marinus]KZE74104.1 RND transporter [Myroides marinus]MDM1373718.1 efflux transporter outer membrane subunit [Myroides marinus]MDM1380465.1 efflux transporter outer membrane subunit [Myroides marinus]MDM1387737.1 efflux transporter outer membrane subunit [Myroides marinus]MDM1390204.1 efflux transporter outer membrane subunit [Myroides marinus]
MNKRIIYRTGLIALVGLSLWSCKTPQAAIDFDSKAKLPNAYNESNDTINSGMTPWRQFFTDKNLTVLIEEALKNNQELLITLQEIEVAKNEVLYKKGRLSPKVGAGIGAGVEKVGRYTSQGAGDATTEIEPGKKMPEPLGDFSAGITASWEIDMWGKLHNAKEAAVKRYLGTVEGKNFILSNLIAEVASNYYELLALDNQLDLTLQYIDLQKKALEIVKIQKQAARGTELGVKKFEAELLKAQGLEFSIKQEITEKENRINALLGRYPQPIVRDKESFMGLVPATVKTGIPAQLLSNRPDIKQAELELEAAKLDVKAARAEFYPSLDISATFGLNAFKPSYLTKLPESIMYSLVGELAAPLINKSAIKAEFNTANAHQVQALYEYDKRIVNAYLDIANQMSKIQNMQKVYEYKDSEAKTLTASVDISQELFKASRADYLEVLMTQREAMDAKLELVETKSKQLNAVVDIYKSLGGGWQ